MSIRQIRLNTTEQIKSRIHEFRGKDIHIVLDNNTAVTGTLREIGADAIVVENKRLRRNRYPFSQITELYFDQRI